MLNWNPSFGLHREQPKSRRRKETVKLSLEVLEDRTMPSGSPLPVEYVASPPPPPPSVAALNSLLVSAMNQEVQLAQRVEQVFISEVKTLVQDIYQEEAALEQKWLNLFGISFTATNQTPSNSVMQPANNVIGAAKGSGSGSGSGSGATTTHHNPNHSIHSFTATPGSGTGNGSSPDSSGGSATVYGNVWLDNNGDGSIDNGESGFVGDTVALFTAGGQSFMTTTTDGSGNYSFVVPNLGPPPGSQYYIQVGIPNLDYATIPGYSQINAEGDSGDFALYAGASVQINAGIRSMNVTTLADDPNGAIPMQITLRDAMETGNNGPPTTAVTFNQGLAGGTISLQAELPAINANYNIMGTGPSLITVNGNDDTGTVFTVNATSEIAGLIIEGGDSTDGGDVDNNGTLTMVGDTITGGEAVDGGDVYNSGTLTLNADTATGGDAISSDGGMSPNGMLPGGLAPGSGGGFFNGADGILNILGGSFSNNKAGTNGGGFSNFGYVHFMSNTLIANNTVTGYGGGIYNAPGGTVSITGSATIQNNTAAKSGGGVDNSGIFTMSGGSILNNRATSNGGGVANSAGNLTLSSVAIQGNQATGSFGGGIYVAGGTVTLKKDTIGGPAAVTKSGKTVANKNLASSGGGIYIAGGTVNITGGGITYNSTTSLNGGGIWINAGKLTLKSPAVVSSNKAAGLGGGMFIDGGTVKATSASISGNTAIGASGGGIFVGAGSLTITGKTKLMDNKSLTGRGGGIIMFGGKVTISGGSIVANSAKVDGGGIYTSGGSLTLQKNVQIKSNSALTQGGGMYLAIGSTTTFGAFPACTVTLNQAGVPPLKRADGQGVYWQDIVGVGSAKVNNVAGLNDLQDGGAPIKGP